MIAEPPSEGATQFIITLLPKFEVVGADGVEGKVGIIAPFPAGDAAEEPIAFIAFILALTPAPITRV